MSGMTGIIPVLLAFAATPQERPGMLVSPAWLADHLKDTNVAILHVGRDRKTYDAGHVPGARFLDWQRLVATRGNLQNELPGIADLEKLFSESGIGGETRVVLYADDVLLATRAYFTLDYLGHGDSTALLDGGLAAWKAGQRDVSTDTPPPAGAAFTARVRPEAVVNKEQVRAFAENGGAVLLDARPAADFKAGSIPGALNVYWGEHVAGKDDPSLKPAAELSRLYEAIPHGKRVIAFCRSGVQATHAYFVLRYLGYEVALYDGSYSDWSASTSR